MASDDDTSQIEPFTEQAAERLEFGFQSACNSLAIDIAEVRESIDDDDVKSSLKDAERDIKAAKRTWSDRYDNSDGEE